MRAVLQVFESYQKARVNFVQTVAELATRPQNIEALQNAGVMQLLRPLLLDNVPSIQQSAALALGRLANYNDELAEAVVSNEILPQLVYSLAEQNVRARPPSTRAPRCDRASPRSRRAARAPRAASSASTRRRRRSCCARWRSTRRSSHRPSSTQARSTRSSAASRSLTRE